MTWSLAAHSWSNARSFREIDGFLRRAETEIALIDRCVPLNALSERQRLLSAWQAGQRVAPQFQFATPPSLGPLRRVLSTLSEKLTNETPIAELYAERAQELELEARAAEALGTRDFAEVAAQRYAEDRGEHGRAAESWARAWANDRPETNGEPRHRSDDSSDPHSLLNSMRRTVGRLRLPIRVEVRANQAAAAATGDGSIFVRSQLSHTKREVSRIVLHEIEAHALPRLRAKSSEIGLLAIGTAQSSDDEEGRALLLERRSGYLDAGRRAELGRRHLAALSVRDGADWVETTLLMQSLGAPLETAHELATRAHRGGGLGREIVYLTALSRVASAVEREPMLEKWLESGRLSVRAALTLWRKERPQSISTMTGI